MFDIGWSELLVIGVVAIIVVGPKELPRLMRTFGHYAGKLRRIAGDFQRQFEDAMREAELDEVRQAMESVRGAAPSLDLSAPIDRPVMLPQPAPALKTEAKTRASKAQTRSKPRLAKAKASGAKPRKSKAAPRKGKTP